jgi:diadenosine tetraphosphate (Ap4A) HIT family hydrolase
MIYEDNNVFIVPDIAPLLVGHFLIVSKVHLNSFAAADDSIYTSLVKAKDYLKAKIYKDSQVLFFEHGAVVNGRGGGTIDHAHMHAIPVTSNVDMDKHIDSTVFFRTVKKQPSSRESLKYFVDDKQPYIYYEVNNESWHYPVYNEIPRQFLRWMATLCLSIKHDWDWRARYKTQESKDLFMQTLVLAKQSSNG